MKVKTVKLQEMLGKAIKGCSNNKMLPITTFINISTEDENLCIKTTDGNNYLYVIDTNNYEKGFECTLFVDTFAKLVSKLNTEYTELILHDNKLEINANGKYSIALPLDENNEKIKFPNPIKEINLENIETTIKLSTIKSIIKTAKDSLAVTYEIPCYTNYYVADSVISTDTYKICELAINCFDEPRLISSQLMNLLDLMDSEEINVYKEDNSMVFVTNNCMVYGKLSDGIEEYQIETIKQLLQEKFSYHCKVNRLQLIDCLDRIALFVDIYDRNSIKLEFKDNSIVVNNKYLNNTEVVKCNYQDNQEFNCLVDIQMLMTQLKSLNSEVIELWYGLPNAIKLVDNSIVQIISLLEE